MLSFDDEDLTEKDLTEKNSKKPLLLPCMLFGPSGYVLDSNVYVAGLDYED
jgi:hypothetical protein